jgi:hypothetical protein
MTSKGAAEVQSSTEVSPTPRSMCRVYGNVNVAFAESLPHSLTRPQNSVGTAMTLAM